MPLRCFPLDKGLEVRRQACECLIVLVLVDVLNDQKLDHAAEFIN